MKFCVESPEPNLENFAASPTSTHRTAATSASPAPSSHHHGRPLNLHNVIPNLLPSPNNKLHPSPPPNPPPSTTIQIHDPTDDQSPPSTPSRFLHRYRLHDPLAIGYFSEFRCSRIDRITYDYSQPAVRGSYALHHPQAVFTNG